MKTLELEKVWTGDGLGQSDAVTLKQIKRSAHVAMYQRVTKNGMTQGYEVFHVKVVEAGTPLPGNAVVPETYEQYPSANRFGKNAWCMSSRDRADQLYDKLHTTTITEETTVLSIPEGEFTVGELATLNKVEYVTAATFVKEACTTSKVRFVREERRNLKGKASKVYVKVNG